MSGPASGTAVGTAAAPSVATLPLIDGGPGLLARIVRLELLVSQQLGEVSGARGLAFDDYLVLGAIRRSPNGRGSPSQICETLHRTSGGMTLTLDRLADAGLLERSPDPTDRRKVVVTLTARGRSLATRVNTALHDWEESLGLSARQHDSATVVLDVLLEALIR